MRRAALIVHVCALALIALACASGRLTDADVDAAARTLRVGTSGDYAPYSISTEDGPGGIDVDVARAYASERRMRVEFVAFRWPDLVDDLLAGRFDVAMSGVTVRPERSLAGQFSVPVDSSGAVALVRDSRLASLDDLDRSGVRILVNRGGHLERVARRRFPRAEVVAIADNRAVISGLLDSDCDAAITDTREAPHWRARAPGLRVLGPFTRDRKAYLLAADRTALASDLNAWLLARAADGGLAAIRARHHESGDVVTAIAAPLPAVLAAIDERLALMPLIAEVKRRDALPVDVPEREARVLDAAVTAVQAAAARRDIAPAERPDEDALRALFRAQIEAAKAIQHGVLARAPADPGSALPDLDSELRPALIRIGDRIAELVVVLPRDLEPQRVRTETSEALVARELDAEHVEAIANALIALTSEPRTKPPR